MLEHLAHDQHIIVAAEDIKIDALDIVAVNLAQPLCCRRRGFSIQLDAAVETGAPACQGCFSSGSEATADLKDPGSHIDRKSFQNVRPQTFEIVTGLVGIEVLKTSRTRSNAGICILRKHFRQSSPFRQMPYRGKSALSTLPHGRTAAMANPETPPEPAGGTMNATTIEPVRISERALTAQIRYSICTLVTDFHEYQGMVRSLEKGGFGAGDCEYLYVDNSGGNTADAFAGYNLFLTHARGAYIILCHQDILLLEDERSVLETRLQALNIIDPSWAICGNAGATGAGKLVIRITDPHGKDQARGLFPTRVSTVDENFIVVRRDANLALSHDLAGFHLYGADLCIIADILGRSAYVIDFHLHHKSGGVPNSGFYQMRLAMMRKYARALRPRWINTTCTYFRLGSSYWKARLLTKLSGRASRR